MNRVYEKPEFGFQELKLSEKIADTCWGTGHAYLDCGSVPGKVDSGDLEIDFGGGCHGDAAANAMNNWFVNHNINKVVSPNVCNTKEPGLIPGGDDPVIPAES